MTIGIEHVNDYPLIRFEIRFERKFPIRRSLLCGFVKIINNQRVISIQLVIEHYTMFQENDTLFIFEYLCQTPILLKFDKQHPEETYCKYFFPPCLFETQCR